MSGTGTDPNSLRYQPVKIVRQFNSTGSLASQASSTSSTGEVQPEPIKCHLIEIKPVECTITGGKQSRCKVGELLVKQEANTTSPVVKLEGTPSDNEAPGPATTSRLIDELFKEFLSIKMETIEAEYHEKQQKEKQEKERQEKVKQLQLQAKDNDDACAGGDGCTTDVGNANRRTHHSKEKSRKSKHKDRSHHRSSKHKSGRRSRHGSRCEENNKDTHSSQEQRDEETNRMSDADRRSSQADSPGPPQLDIGSDNTNGMAEITPAPAGNSDVNTDTETIQKDLRVAVPAESSRTTSPGELESNVCHAPNKHCIPIVRVVAVKSSKPGTETAGNGNRGTVVEVSTHLQQEAYVRAEKEDSLWDIALTSKGQDTKSDKEVPAPRNVFEKTDVTVKPLGFKFGIKISEKSAELISSQNKEEGEVSGTDSDSGNNNDGETESVSGSDGETKSGKKKKRKHRHRKRKKHKRGSGDREGTSRKRPRSTSRSRTPKKHRHSRSRSRSTSRSRLRTGRWGRSRSRSRDRHWRSRSRDRDHHRHRSRSRSRGRRRSPLKDIYRGWRSRSRSHSRDKKKKNDLRVKIDKAKLRQIAIARAFNNMQTGQGPPVDFKPEQLLALKAGGHSVQELTDFCKKISQKDKPRRSSSDDTSDSTQNEEEEEAGPFIHHPFKLRDNQPNIVMNIANAKQLPILTPAMKASLGAELRVQFPVSSGSQHRAKEWVTVEKSTPVQVTAKVSTAPPSQEDSVFPDPSAQPVSIGDVVSERLSAMRQLQSNPNDVQALTKIHHVDRQMESWVTSKMLPGQFTGSTDVQMLSQKELHGGYQAWIRKDQFARAAPVRGGIGMSLLQKMGWKQGEGLGKDNNGSLEPLALSVKMDRKGLSSQGENIKKLLPVPTRKDLSGKHPISALVELCNKKKWGPPDFIVVNESGPDHKKNFIIKVKVKGMEYQPSVSSGSKKLAKAQAATVCLQKLGLIPQ